MKRRLICAILGLVLLVGGVAVNACAEDEDRRCLACHIRGSSESLRQIDGGLFKASVHGGEVSCVECHPQARNPSHQESMTVTPVKCQRCHDQTSRHGREAGESVQCWDCHSGHGVFVPSDSRSSLHALQQGRTCGRCHPERSKAGSMAVSILSLRVRGHGKADPSRAYSADNCLACHRPEAGHGDIDHAAVQGCRECHTVDSNRTGFLGTFHGPSSLSDVYKPSHLGNLFYVGLFGVFLVIFAGGWIRTLRIWMRGGPAGRWNHLGRRLVRSMATLFKQRKVFERKTAGISHYLIFLGVGVPIVIVLIAQLRPSLGIWPARALSLLLDILGLGLILGVSLATLRRVRQPDEFEVDSDVGWGILFLLLCIAVTGFATSGLRAATSSTQGSLWSPVGGLLAMAFPSSPWSTAVIWRVHLLLALAFLALIPWTRLRHAVLAPVNTFFENMRPRGRLEPVDVHRGERFGVSHAADQTWKDLLDTDCCMACGRCQEVCPAYATEKPLSPFKVIRDMHTDARSSLPPAQGLHGWDETLHVRIAPEETWACLTCYACQEACPVSIEHVKKVMGLRRSLVMDEGSVPREAGRLLRNLEVYGDPMGHGPALRREWAHGLPGRAFRREPAGGMLLWVGCQAAFHPRARETAQALVIIADRSRMPLAILGSEEICCGDPARRLGDEALFQEIAARNVERFQAHAVTNVVTLCPHCFNTLAHEYPDFGSEVRVLHAVEWVESLVKSGRLRVERSMQQTFTYHDPCYLGRVNRLARFPRAVADAIPGLKLQEMMQSRDETFCCGAGGGHMWLHESGTRINQARADQCLQTSADLVCTSCPYCLTMLEDGLKEVGSRPVAVQDLIEVLEIVTR